MMKTAFAIMAFIPRTPESEEQLTRLRTALRDATGLATSVGFGPRYLHSTGQLFKGGPDKGVFMNQFFKSGKLEDNGKLSFTTENVHGVWFEFAGNVVRGSGTKPDDEAYYVLRGSLTRFDTDADKKTTSQQRTVELKSFPRDATAK